MIVKCPFSISDALTIAITAHYGQTDNNGIDYIKHPMWVYHGVLMDGGSEHAQMAALLHDVVEDSDVTFEDLREHGCPEEVIEALKLLTHVVDKDYIKMLKKRDDLTTDKAKFCEYLNYITILKSNPIARLVKKHDLKHNTLLERYYTDDIGDVTDVVIVTRWMKYVKAYAILTDNHLI